MKCDFANNYQCLWLPCIAALLLALGGCPRGDSLPPKGNTVEPANLDESDPDGADAAAPADSEASIADGENPPDEPVAESTPPLNDGTRETFIAEMREMGVSVELDDDKFVKSLVMGFTKIDDAGLAKLPPLPRLEFIGLDHTNITDKGLESLGKRASLRAVYLGGNDLSAAGLKHIAALEKIEYLDLSDLPLGDDALKHLAKLKSLKKLNLTSTKVSLEETIAFAKAFDDLEVSAPFGNLIGGRRLTMDPGVEDGDLAKLKSLESLRELNLWECDNITDAGIGHVAALSQLTTLELGYTQVSDAGLAKLAALNDLEQLDVRETKTSIASVLKLANKRPQLHVLTDWGKVAGSASVHFEPEVTDKQLANLVHAANLQQLNLWRCDQLTDAAMQHVAKCEHLQELNLGATNIGDEGIAALTNLKLQRLMLANTSVTDKGIADVGKMKSLVELDLSSTATTSEGVKALQGLSNLQSLNLARTPIQDDFVSALAELPTLESLDMSETSVGAGAGELVNLGRLPKLRRVDLSLTLIDDEELESLARCQNIEDLDLWGTTITDEGLKHLYQMKQLKRLGLFGTPVSNEAVTELQKALPEIEVIHGFDTVDTAN